MSYYKYRNRFGLSEDQVFYCTLIAKFVMVGFETNIMAACMKVIAAENLFFIL